MAAGVDATFALANQLFRNGDFARAAAVYRLIVAQRPRDATVRYNLATALQAAGDRLGACEQYREALRIKPAMVDAAANLGSVLIDLGQAEQAAGILGKLVRQAPKDVEARISLGQAMLALRRTEEALDHFRYACDTAPDRAEAHYNLAQALFEARQLDAAADAYLRAVELRPDWPEAICGLGNVARQTFDFPRAEELYRRALTVKPDHVTALINLAITLSDFGRMDEAIALLREAQRLEPANALAYWNEASFRLWSGDFGIGLERYEWRWRTGEQQPRLFPLPQWQGQALPGRLLLWGEQGVGDELLFSSLLDELLARGLSCLVETDERLVPLMRRSYPDVSFVPRQHPPHPETRAPGVSAHCPLGSLPLRLRWTRPQPVRSRLLKADSERFGLLRRRYQERAAGRTIVGIAWTSRNAQNGRVRSCPLELWGPVLRRPDLLFINLQYGDVASEIANAAAAFGAEIVVDGDIDQWRDLDGFAAQVAATDRVVSIDNSTIHMAGRLGIPTWVLLNEGYGAAWYWQRGRQDSFWHASLRLFRQAAPGDWSRPLSEIAKELA